MLASPLFASLLCAEGYESAWIYIPVLTAATVYTALDTFLGSVYFTGRRTMWSMLTAFVGATLNILLNLLLIPDWGAAGASLATFVAYFAVFILRLVTTRRLIPFRQEWGRWIVNTILILTLAAAVTLTGGDHGAVLWGLAGVLSAALLAFNARAVLEILRGVLRAVHHPAPREP